MYINNIQCTNMQCHLHHKIEQIQILIQQNAAGVDITEHPRTSQDITGHHRTSQDIRRSKEAVSITDESHRTQNCSFSWSLLGCCPFSAFGTLVDLLLHTSTTEYQQIDGIADFHIRTSRLGHTAYTANMHCTYACMQGQYAGSSGLRAQ